MPKAKEVTFSIPGWFSATFEPNESERIAAWNLYVELATRVATQPFDRSTGSLRGALSSLHEVFRLTRQILREAGPSVAHSDNSFGPIAIRFLIEVLAPFLLKWHEPLQAYEATKPPEVPVLVHEQAWSEYPSAISQLQDLQSSVQAYVAALREIADVSGG